MKIFLMNDPVLRRPTPDVHPDDLDFIKSQIPEMTALMTAEDGAGLAANQVGISKRFFILKDGETVKLYINPTILSKDNFQPFMEGCLSIPGVQAETQRAQDIKLKYFDETFTEKEETFTGFTAVAIQHEVDHLEGKLYIDLLKPLRMNMVMDKHRKFIKMRGRMGL